jgi:hypothetical protein
MLENKREAKQQKYRKQKGNARLKTCQCTTEDLAVARINSTSYPGKKQNTKTNNDTTLTTTTKDPTCS